MRRFHQSPGCTRSTMKIGRARKSWKAINCPFIDFQFSFSNGFPLSACNDERPGRITRAGKFHETIIVTVGACQLNIVVIAVRKSANGLRSNKNILREPGHGSPNWNIAKSFCKYLVIFRSNPVWARVSAGFKIWNGLKAAPVLARGFPILLRYRS